MNSIRRARRLGKLVWGVYLGGLITVLWLIFVLLFAHSFFEGVTLEFPPRGLTFANYLQITTQFFPALRVSLLLGLCAGIVTTSLKHASHFKRNADVGMVMVNLPTAGVDYHVPFGGRKGSSYGPREQGRYAAEFFTTVKTAYIAP